MTSPEAPRKSWVNVIPALLYLIVHGSDDAKNDSRETLMRLGAEVDTMRAVKQMWGVKRDRSAEMAGLIKRARARAA